MPGWFNLLRFFKRQNTGSAQEALAESIHGVLDPWWGTSVIEDNESRFWKVGNSVVCLDRYNDEWHIAHSYKSTLSTDETPLPQTPSATLDFKTFVLRNQGFEATIKPSLADRSLVSHLERPLHIPGGEKIILYVSSPVWIKVTVGKSNITLDEIPSLVLSDTWFGQNTREGELCYADKTRCSPQLEEFSHNTNRVISPLLIKNRSKETLVLEQISVPLPFLSVYADDYNRLWTEQLVIHRHGGDDPEVRVAKGAPKSIAGNVALITRPRIEIKATASLKHLFFTLIGRQIK